MKTVQFVYWMGSKFHDLPYEHNQRKVLLEDSVYKMVSFILSKGYQVMLSEKDDVITLMIDNGRFRQR